MFFIFPETMTPSNDQQKLAFLWQQQTKYKKRWAVPLAVIAVAFPLAYIPNATDIPAPWNQISLTIAMLCVLGLAFLNRLGLMTNKWKYGKQRDYRKLLEFADSDDFKKLSIEEALEEMEKRRQAAWRMR